MAEIISEITLDVVNKLPGEPILAKQGDKASRFLKIRLQNGDEKVTIPPTAKVYLNAEKPDKTVTKTAGTVLEDGTIKVGFTNQTLARDGQVTCDVSVVNGDSVLTSLKFTVQVEPSTAGDDVVVSTDEFTDLNLMVIRVDELETTVTANEAERVANETARQAAEIGRIAENERVEELINSFVGDMPIANTVTPGAVKAGGDIVISSTGLMTLAKTIKDTLKFEQLKADNPIGTVRQFAVATNPATLLGFGTWKQVQIGRVGVGVDMSDPDFNVISEKGGEKTHTLTKSEMPSHEHYMGSPNLVQNTAVGSVEYGFLADGSYRSTNSAGDDQPHNNLQPYECFYYWQRTA